MYLNGVVWRSRPLFHQYLFTYGRDGLAVSFPRRISELVRTEWRRNVGFGCCEHCGRSIRAGRDGLLANESVCNCRPLHSELVTPSSTMLRSIIRTVCFGAIHWTLSPSVCRGIEGLCSTAAEINDPIPNCRRQRALAVQDAIQLSEQCTTGTVCRCRVRQSPPAATCRISLSMSRTTKKTYGVRNQIV